VTIPKSQYSKDAMPDQSDASAQKKPLDESMLASATWSATPRAGIVLSSFAGGEEHDGTKLAGLADPQPVDKPLTPAQITALLRKAMELASRAPAGSGGGGGGRRRSQGQGPGSDEWAVILITLNPTVSTDPQLVAAYLEDQASQRRGKRFTIAAGSTLPPAYATLVASLTKRYPQILFDTVDLSKDAFIESPSIRRTFAKNNPQGLYAIANTIRECDRVVSIAPLQVSRTTGVALAVANYWAVAPPSAYGPRKEKLASLGDPVDVLTDLYLHRPADYAIVGGSVHQDAGGPVHHNIVIAGSNAVSVDSIGAAVMGFDPEKLPLLDRLEARGFGVISPDSIWTRGNEIEQARKPFRKPQEFAA
jgi:uncharacterized protein (DUF362 family)